MAKPIKVEAYARLTIHWDGDPSDEDLASDKLWEILFQSFQRKRIEVNTTRFRGRAKSSSKFIPKHNINK